MLAGLGTGSAAAVDPGTAGAARGVLISSSVPGYSGSGSESFLEEGEELEEEDWLAALTRLS